MAAAFRGINLINIHAPSANAKRREREHFFNNVLAYLVKDASTNIFLGGDFNCVLETVDSTGHYTYSKPLDGLGKGFDVQDGGSIARGVCNSLLPTGGTRIDRFYATKNLFDKKIAADIGAAFTDHHAVTLRLVLDIPILHRGSGLWNMNNSLLGDVDRKAKLRHNWEKWTRQKRHCPYTTMRWSRLVKKNIRQFYIQEGVKRRRNIGNMEQFLGKSY